MASHLFIGGSHDGEHIETEPRFYVTIPEKAKVSVQPGMSLDVNNPQSLKVETYRREMISAGLDRRTAVYVEQSMSVSDAVDCLIRGYKRVE